MYAQDRASRHMARIRKGKHLCVKKHHPFGINWCWSCLQADELTHEGPWWYYWYTRQSQNKTDIRFNYHWPLQLCEGLQESVSFCEKQADVQHDRCPYKGKRCHAIITMIKENIARHGNPFCIEDSYIHNLIIHAYIPDGYVTQILNIDTTNKTEALRRLCVRENQWRCESLGFCQKKRNLIWCTCLATRKFGTRL